MLLAGLGTGRSADVQRAAPPAGEATSGSGSFHRSEPDPSLAAVEVGRAPLLARSEGSRGSPASRPLLAAAGLALAALALRIPARQGLLERSIRARATAWRPAPGGRAPPRPSTS